MAIGTVAYRSDMITPQRLVGWGATAPTWKMTQIAGAFPDEQYEIIGVFMDVDVLKTYGADRHMVITRDDGTTIGNISLAAAGFQKWVLRRDVSYEGMTSITTDGGDKDACVIRAGTYITIYVNWQSTKPVIVPSPTQHPNPIVRNAIKPYKNFREVLHSEVAVSFDGVDISSPINESLISLSYTDNEEDEADDLQIKIHDKSKKWLDQWLNDSMIQAVKGANTGTKGLTISAGVKQYRKGLVKSGDFGLFELDSIKVSGPPSNITIKGTSLPFGGIRSEERNKSWEDYNLSGIGREIAQKAGLSFVYDCPDDPTYSRVEQSEQTDISFLMQLCHDKGYSLKISGMQLVIFDQKKYESMQSAATVRWMDGTYTKYDLSTSDGETHYDEVNVVYYDVSGAVRYTATARTDDYDEEASDHTICTVTTRKVHSADAAGALAKEILRLHNKFEKKLSFTLIGNPILGAGMTMTVEGFGLWDGKYIIKQCKHEIGSNGYTTKVTLRTIPEGSVTKTTTQHDKKNAVETAYGGEDLDGTGGGKKYVSSDDDSGGGGGSGGNTPTFWQKAATSITGKMQGAISAAASAISLLGKVSSAAASASKPVSKGGGYSGTSASFD